MLNQYSALRSGNYVPFNPSLALRNALMTPDGSRLIADNTIKQSSVSAHTLEAIQPSSEKFVGSVAVPSGYFQLVSGVNRSRFGQNQENSRGGNLGTCGESGLFLKAQMLEGGQWKTVWVMVWNDKRDAVLGLSPARRSDYIRQQALLFGKFDNLRLYSGPEQGAPINSKPQTGDAQAAPKRSANLVTLPSGENVTVNPETIIKTKYSVGVRQKNGDIKFVPIGYFVHKGVEYYGARHPQTKEFVISMARQPGVQLSREQLVDMGDQLRAIFEAALAKPSASTAPVDKPKRETFKRLDSVSNTLRLDKNTQSDFGQYENDPGKITFNVAITRQQETKPGEKQTVTTQESHVGTVGLVQLQSGKQVLAVEVAMSGGKKQLVLLPNVKYAGVNPQELAATVAVNLGQLHANGKIAVDATSKTGKVLTPTEIKDEAKRIEEACHILLELANIGLLVTGAGELLAAARTYLAFRKLLAEGVVLTGAQLAKKKAAEAVLVGFGIGAVAGGSSYTIYVQTKYWDEATLAIAQGRNMDALSAGAKGLIQLLNYTLGAGKTSADLALTNVSIGRALATGTLGGTAASWQRGWNWGMFVDPKSWTRANILSVFGDRAGQAMLTKYQPILEWLNNPANRNNIVDASGKLLIPENVIRSANIAGVTNTAEPAGDMMKSGFWRVFSSAPVLGSPFRTAWTTSRAGTVSAYTQLALTRGATGMAVNLFWQSVSGAVLNKEVRINLAEILGSGVSGPFRAMGAPGAWLAELGGRFGSCGISSAAAFAVSYGWSQIWKQRETANPKEAKGDDISFSTAQWQILSRTQGAFSAALTLLVALDKNASSSAADKKFVAPYLNRLHDLAIKGKDQIEAKAKALDSWLNGSDGAGVTRRQRLDNFRLDWEPGLALAVKTSILAGHIQNVNPVGSFQDLGITRQFSKVSEIKTETNYIDNKAQI